MNHLAECEVKGSHHPQFDIPTQISILFRPTAFMGNLLAMLTTDFSLFQLGHNLQLAWAQGHNSVVAALVFENRRLGLAVVDLDAAMLRHCTHLKRLTSQARGDILVRTNELAYQI